MGRIFEKKNLIKLITYITMIIILIPILIIALYNHPSADDYGYSDTVYKTIQVGGNCFDIIKEAIPINKVADNKGVLVKFKLTPAAKASILVAIPRVKRHFRPIQQTFFSFSWKAS